MKTRWALIAMILCAAPATADDLRPFQRGSWQAVRQQHQGQPAIIHFWGLTCGPCLAELPAWGALARQYPGLALVTVAADPTPEPPGALTAALDKAGLSRTENWMFDGMSARLRWEIDPLWQGELPMTVMVAADGTSSTTLGTADMDAVRSWLAAQPHR